jgi:hypothetical protein
MRGLADFSLRCCFILLLKIAVVKSLVPAKSRFFFMRILARIHRMNYNADNFIKMGQTSELKSRTLDNYDPSRAAEHVYLCFVALFLNNQSPN